METGYAFECGTSGCFSAVSRGEVQVWFTELDQPDAVVRRLEEVLCPDEQRRAMQFRFQRDRQRFIVARAVLRDLLGRYLGTQPRNILFQYGEFGKPSLAGGLEASQLQFNVSHSGNGALYAVGQGWKVGADVEFIRPFADMHNVAYECFSADENAALISLPECDQLRAFFDGWTRKEAYLKAEGYGLSCSTRAFEVSLAPGTGPRALTLFHQDRPWTLISLAPRPEFSAAVVVEGPEPRVRFTEWMVDGHEPYWEPD
jgi:4'-phosphopantetheinyl transferase